MLSMRTIEEKLLELNIPQGIYLQNKSYILPPNLKLEIELHPKEDNFIFYDETILNKKLLVQRIIPNQGYTALLNKRKIESITHIEYDLKFFINGEECIPRTQLVYSEKKIDWYEIIDFLRQKDMTNKIDSICQKFISLNKYLDTLLVKILFSEQIVQNNPNILEKMFNEEILSNEEILNIKKEIRFIFMYNHLYDNLVDTPSEKKITQIILLTLQSYQKKCEENNVY